MIIDSNKDSAFWNKIALKYSKTPIANQEAYEKKLAQTQSYFEPNMDILELGCGTGSTAILHSKHVNSITALDISQNMIEIAEQKIKDLGIQNVNFECEAFENYDFKNKKYQMVLAMSVLHLMRDRDFVIKKIYDHLDEGGIFISSTACINDMSPIAKLIAPLFKILGPLLERFEKLPFLDFFGHVELIKTLEKNNFQIIDKWQPSKKEAWFIIAKK